MENVKEFLTLILATAGLYFWIVLYSWWKVWRGGVLTAGFVKYMRIAFFAYVVVLFLYFGVDYFIDSKPRAEQSIKSSVKKMSVVDKAMMQLDAGKTLSRRCLLEHSKEFCDAVNEEVRHCVNANVDSSMKYEDVIAECQSKSLPQ